MYYAIIVEDDPVITKINTAFLKELADITLLKSFRNGYDAIDYISNNHVDLILLDYHLPGMNGLDFLKKVREKNSNIAVIVITMDNNADAVTSLMSCGITDYLLKPYKKERFMQSISLFFQHMNTIKHSNYISQNDLDSLILNNSITAESSSRKGIQKETSSALLDILRNNPGKSFTIEELAETVSLSKVTIRRYLTHFTEEGLVNTEINYTTGGRPSVIYIYNN